jgi:ectoine hydroxylase-related dioxygenase (phytanoyl-CoA dioxygenase family)
MMHCAVIGVSPITLERVNEELAYKLSQQVREITGSQVTLISSSIARDEDGTPTLLLSCVTNSSVEDLVAAVSAELSNDYVCELWGSAPAILPLRPHGGYHPHLFYDNATGVEECEWAQSTLKQWGMFVQNDLLSADEVVQLRQAVLTEIDNAESLLKLHHPEINIGQDIMSFKEIASRGNERFDLLLPSSSMPNQLVSQVINSRVSFILEKTLGVIGVDVDCDISVVYSKPGAPSQGWHADGDHQQGENDAGLDADGWKTCLSETYALCLFIPLIDLDDDTGYTQFWPCSHRNRGLAGFGRFAEIAEATFNGKCKAGSAIWYDYRLMHRGIKNDSTLLRPVLQLLFKRNWYRETRNYGKESIIPFEESS